MDEDKLNTISIDGDQSDTLVKLLDSVVIYLEGGSELDLQVNFKKSYLYSANVGAISGQPQGNLGKISRVTLGQSLDNFLVPGSHQLELFQ